MKYMKTRITAIAASLLLVACGGGGGDEGSSGAAGSAEGFWSGTLDSGVAVSAAILENGETWGVYTSGSLIVGALYGQTTSSGTTLSGSGTAFDIANRSSSNGTYSGTFTPKSAIRITSSDGGIFSGTYEAKYDQPAVLSNVAGSFTGQGVSGNSTVQSIPLSIATNGTLTATGTAGCSATGALTPRSTGKNIFNVSVTFTGTNCALGNGTVTTGVGYYDTEAQRLLVLAMNASKTDGFIYIGSKAAPV